MQRQGFRKGYLQHISPLHITNLHILIEPMTYQLCGNREGNVGPLSQPGGVSIPSFFFRNRYYIRKGIAFILVKWDLH